LVDGKKITDGADLPVLGTIKLQGKNIFANKPLELSKDTVDGLADLGL
jgi:simple sugar transport system substrate-binding protein